MIMASGGNSLVRSFDLVSLRSPRLAMDIAPELGAKVVSLRSAGSGREWLWSHPRLEHKPGAAGASYVREYDSGGWDEMFPTISPVGAGEDVGGVWSGQDLSDHGEVWHRVWQTTERAPRATTTRLVDGTSGFSFSRRLSLGRDGLDAAYVLRNDRPAEMPFIWAAHPLFAVEPGMSLRVPDSAETMVLGHDRSRAWADLAKRAAFLKPGCPWSTDDLASGFTKKLFVRVKPGDTVSLVAPDGEEALEVSSPSPLVSYIGLWINFGGWSGDGGEPLVNIGIEPTSSPYDSLADAAGDSSSLAPLSAVEWSFSMRLVEA